MPSPSDSAAFLESWPAESPANGTAQAPAALATAAFRGLLSAATNRQSGS